MPEAECERRCCDDCGRMGRDGGSTRWSFCGGCQETVPYPDKDKCPACGAENQMLIACASCGGRYVLVEDDDEWFCEAVAPPAEMRARPVKDD